MTSLNICMQDKYFIRNIFRNIEDEALWISSTNKLWRNNFLHRTNSYNSITSIKRLKFLIQTQSVDLFLFADFLAKNRKFFRMFKFVLNHMDIHQVIDLLDRANSYKSKYYKKLLYTLDDRKFHFFVPNWDVNYNAKFFETYAFIYGIRHLEQDWYNFVYTAIIYGNIDVLEWFKRKNILCNESSIYFICDHASEKDLLGVFKWVYRNFGDNVILDKNIYLYKTIEYKSVLSFLWIHSLYNNTLNRRIKNRRFDQFIIYSIYDADFLYDNNFDQEYWEWIFYVLNI